MHIVKGVSLFILYKQNFDIYITDDELHSFQFTLSIF